MKALMSVTPGGPETLQYMEQDPPTPGKGEVIIAVKAAGVNFPDTLIIRDLYQFKPPRPFAPGGEVAGVVAALGEEVRHLKIGDRVAALVGPFGGYATHARCDAAAVMKIDDDLPVVEAAGFLMTYGTSYYALKDRAKLSAGETLLVLGAAGGVGSAAVELGKAMGAKVVAAVSSQEKADFVSGIGADEAVIYPASLKEKSAQKDLSKAFKDACGGGADVIYDAVGGAYAEPAVRAIAWEGRFLVVGFPAGIPTLPLNLTLLKSCQIMGVFWGAAVMRDPASNAQNMAEIQSMIRKGMLCPQVTETYPLSEGAKALEKIESRQAMGKIVLTIDND
ncbi:MAG: NADPH:quinone oxidoreductase family protein [Pseudomonadota bacterium]